MTKLNPAKRDLSAPRKRLKSDSRIVSSPKSEISKENKDVETKKKKFEFTPTRDMFRNFKMGRKAKGGKAGALAKGEAKSCEFLDESAPLGCGRCAKSAECLEAPGGGGGGGGAGDEEAELSLELSDEAVASLALPQEIVALLLRARTPRAPRPAPPPEGHYLPMSPLLPLLPPPPLPLDHHYIAMSPRARLA